MENKVKFLILDVYPNNNWRICKDTAGGYGTGNDFGNSLFSKFLNVFTNNQIHQPSMYIGYLMKIIDTANTHVQYSNKLSDAKNKDYDFIILTSSIVAHETEIHALNELLNLNKKVFITGIFSNVLKEVYLKKDLILINGEPENFFLNLNLENKGLNELLNFFELNKGKEINTGFVEDLDSLPFPAWDKYNKIHKLKNNFLNFDNRVAIPILATRGCPYSCFNYCTYPLQQGRKVRSRSPENIVKEIEFWLKKFNQPKFVFRDPVFSINRKHTIELCKLIISKKIKIDFLIETHLKNLDDELILFLRSSGLKIVYVGVESKHTDVLKNINRFTVAEDDQYKIIEKLEKNRIIVKSMFMIGNPEDTEEKVLETIEYSKKLKNSLVQFSVFTPYPGTPMYNFFKEIVIEKKLEKFNQYNLVFKHKYLNNKKVVKLKNLAYKNFYLRLNTFKIIFIFIKNLFSLSRKNFFIS